MNTIDVSAVVFRNLLGQVLCVRKRGTQGFMMPGGKPEPGESAELAACREVLEELGVAIAPVELEFLGVFSAPALNEAGTAVRAQVFEWVGKSRAQLLESMQPAAEIDELLWVDLEAFDASHQAPLNTEAIFPLLRGADLPFHA